VKQGSAGEVKLPYLVPHEFNRSALHEYETLLEAGVAPEQARMVLPQSTMTEWYWSGSLDAFADMCNLRCKSDTQAETRLVAQQIDYKMIELFPVSWDALTEDDDDKE
jgi:thymidylate synthase (FAD)